MESKSIYTILLAIIAVLTLALAVLIIFLFVTYNPNVKAPAGGIQADGTIAERIVPDDEMIEFKLFGGEEKMFALKSEPEHLDAIVLVSVTLKCDAGPKKKKETEITALVNDLYLSELEEAVGDYFAAMTLTEAREIETRYKARDDLMNTFNEILNANKHPKEKIVYKVTLQMFAQ